LPDFYAENERVFTLRTVEDTLKIRAFVEQKRPKTADIIGGALLSAGDVMSYSSISNTRTKC
jgi:NAD(P)H-nitrite reductase large subunit